VLATDVDTMQKQLDVLTQRVQDLIDVPAPPPPEALIDQMDAMQTQLDGLTQTVGDLKVAGSPALPEGAAKPALALEEMQSQDAMKLATVFDEIKGQIAPLQAQGKELQHAISQLE
ncbi:unnamed protein product, partial [Prorocentrum cordatum]